MAASRKLKSKIIDLCISFWSHRFLYKQWNLNHPPTLSQNQIAITVQDFTESEQAADVGAFVRERTSSKLPNHHLLAYLTYLSKRKVFSLVIPLSFVSPILDSFDLN